MSQEKRVFLTAGLSFLTILLWYSFFGKNLQHSQSPQSSVPQTQPAVSTTLPSVPAEIKPAQTTTTLPAMVRTYPEEIVPKENSVVRVEWSSSGGRPKRILMKNYRQTAEKESPLIDLMPYEGEKAADLVCDRCNFALPGENEYQKIAEDDHSISFAAENAAVRIVKTYDWTMDQYLFNAKVTLENKTGQALSGALGLQWRARQIADTSSGTLGFLKAQSSNKRTFLYNMAGKVEHDTKLESKTLPGVLSWAGIEDRYFLIALISRKTATDQQMVFKSHDEWMNLSLVYPPVVLGAGEKHEETYSLYLGPRHHDYLKVAGVGLERAIDYGWFSILAVPIVWLLQGFHYLISNWGLAVILLTLFIKILMTPLTIKSMKQMKEMQKLQPKLAQIKAKYPEDRQKQQMETMALFKAHNVNPMSGCLPMILQMPVYVVLYKVLYNAIELYHAPFFGFYRDLSAPDPYFILPILLGVAMVLQQKLTPSANADPMQRQMMMIMPIMFTALMLFLPLGLVLYIFVNTATGVLQQVMYQKGLRWRDVLRGNFKPQSS